MNIDYEKIENIVMLFWDSEENYKLEKTKQKLGKLFKAIHLITSNQVLRETLKSYPIDQEFLCFVHLSHSQANKGYDDFINSKILRDYPSLRYYLITSALRNEVYNEKNESLDVYTYDGYQAKIFKTFIPQTKGDIEGRLPKINSPAEAGEKIPSIEYVIITALEEDEMEKVLPMISVTNTLKRKKHFIQYGHLTSNPDKKIAFASQLSTGMVDAAILTTELINTFNPNFVIMAGVLGGKPKDVSIGDVVIATKVFTIDKGKLTDVGFKKEIEASNTDNAFITSIKRRKKDIINFIGTSDPTRNTPIDIHFGPISCVRHVIDKDGFFDAEIGNVDRKAIALEMESYGVSRACELVEKSPAVLIIKSAMDNTVDKLDNAKPYAAWTSAMVVKYILENDVI